MKKIIVKKCEKCGVPLGLHTLPFAKFTWWDNGTYGIKGGKAPHYQFFNEVEDALAVIEGIGEKMGFPVERIFFGTMVQAVLDAFIHMFNWRYSFFLKLGFVRKKIASDYFCPFAKLDGYGIFEVVNYRPKQGVIVKIRNPFHSDMAVAMVGAYFKVVEKVPSVEIEKEVVNGAILARVKASLKEFKFLEYFPYRQPKILPGNIKYERCSRCGVPLEFSNEFEWDLKKGSIRSKITGKRIIPMCRAGFYRVLDALREEIGEDISQVAMELEKEYRRKQLLSSNLKLKGREKDYMNLLRPFTWRGMGNPVRVEKQDRVLKVKIENPYNDFLSAGFVGGLYEAIEKREARVQWTPSFESGYSLVTVKPK